MSWFCFGNSFHFLCAENLWLSHESQIGAQQRFLMFALLSAVCSVFSIGGFIVVGEMLWE